MVDISNVMSYFLRKIIVIKKLNCCLLQFFRAFQGLTFSRLYFCSPELPLITCCLLNSCHSSFPASGDLKFVIC